MDSHRPHVVIVGAGFGGLSAAKALRRAPVRVTVVDRTNHHLFQPLLYQVATGVLSPADIAWPTRLILHRQRNAEVRMATVERVDADRRAVVLDGGERELAYDFLILAPGSRHSYFGHTDWEDAAPGLKSVGDATRIRSRVFRALEEAEKTDDPAERAALLTFVIVGAGPTGVELAGILPTITRVSARRDFRRVDPDAIRVLLVEGGPRVLPTFDERLSARACRDLEDLGVEVRTNTFVTDLGGGVVTMGEERLAARTVLWAAGNETSPLVRTLGVATDRSGRVLVSPDLSVPGHPEVFVIGDAAAAPLLADDAAPSWDGGASTDATAFVPGVAPAANQMGAHAARTIAGELRGVPRRPFRYRDKGSLAVIGPNRAVLELGRVRAAGWFAWMFWLFIHVLYLVGFRSRIAVTFSWGYAYLTRRPSAGLISEDARPAGAGP